MIKPLLAGLIGALMMIGGATLASGYHAAAHEDHEYPEARSYAVSKDAVADVDGAMARAAEANKRALIVMGANWCHDSRALAGWLGTPRFASLIEREYELVFVNVGMPQSGDGHNLEVAQRFGIDELPGTPNLLVVTPQGAIVNADTATTWRNAASRSEDAIFEELERLAKQPV
ncbi:MAG: thioredoxin family protein [Pseudomonadota bacterium]